MNPLQYAIYKGLSGKFGAAQFQLYTPSYQCSKQDCKARNKFEPKCPKSNDESHRMQPREGCVFLEMTSATGPNIYNWENKIVMALGIVDIGKVLNLFRKMDPGSSLTLTHDPGAGSSTRGQVTKELYINSPKGADVGCLLTMSQKKGDSVQKHTVPVTADELSILKQLFAKASARILGW